MKTLRLALKKPKYYLKFINFIEIQNSFNLFTFTDTINNNSKIKQKLWEKVYSRFLKQ